MRAGRLLFALLPQFLNRVVVRRRGRQLQDLQPGSLLGAAGLGLGTGMIPGAILNQENGLRRLLQYPSEKGHVRCGIETSFLSLIQETPGAVRHQAEDFLALAFAGHLDLGLLPTPRPRGRERAPLRERRFIAKQ